MAHLDWALVLVVATVLLYDLTNGFHDAADMVATAIEDGPAQLGGGSPRQLEREIDRIRALYDEVVSHCVQAAARLNAGQGCLELLHQRDLLQQLKEIARRIHVAANTLEDMAIKVM